MPASPARLLIAAAALLALLAACSPRPPAAAPVAGPAGPEQQGRVVALRPVDDDARLRAGLLAAIGTDGPAVAAPITEVIVAVDSGETLSVIEPQPAAFAPGARVAILRGSRLELLPSPGG